MVPPHGRYLLGNTPRPLKTTTQIVEKNGNNRNRKSFSPSFLDKGEYYSIIILIRYGNAVVAF